VTEAAELGFLGALIGYKEHIDPIHRGDRLAKPISVLSET
jgi:hypothetical protein